MYTYIYIYIYIYMVSACLVWSLEASRSLPDCFSNPGSEFGATSAGFQSVEIPYKGKSLTYTVRGNPLYRETHHKGKSLVKGDPLERGIPYNCFWRGTWRKCARIHTCVIYIYIYMCIYMYIYRERERCI